MEDVDILGTSKMAPDGKITLVSDVRRILGVSAGSIIVFFKDKNGDVIIRNGSVHIENKQTDGQTLNNLQNKNVKSSTEIKKCDNCGQENIIYVNGPGRKCINCGFKVGGN